MKEHKPFLNKWKQRAKKLKNEVYVLLLAYQHPDTPWYAKVFAAVVVAYAFSPIDLIPDFIPVLGYLDDLILIPLGIAAVIKMIPANVIEECRQQAEEEGPAQKKPNWISAAVIILIWITLAVLLLRWILGLIQAGSQI